MRMLAAVILALSSSLLWANTPAAEFDYAAHSTHGPATVPLLQEASLKLPEGYILLDKAGTHEFLRETGNQANDNEFAAVLMPDNNWFVIISHTDEGHISDEDAKDWNADDLLASFEEGTEQSNAWRRENQIPEMEVRGWAEKPQYDSSSKKLIWSLKLADKGAPAQDDVTINYNTLALGREGYIGLNLVTNNSTLAQDRPHVRLLLDGLEFNAGRRYADYNAETDRTAAYGLAALVAGAGAKKLGFFALIAAFFAKFAKVFVIGAIALGVGLKKWFGRNGA